MAQAPYKINYEKEEPVSPWASLPPARYCGPMTLQNSYSINKFIRFSNKVGQIQILYQGLQHLP